jgi:hypothetical protein
LAAPRVLLDPDVPFILAEGLRRRGHDVVHAYEVGLEHRLDPEVFRRALELRRTVMTHNVGDFMALVESHGLAGAHHHGLILAAQGPFKTLLARASHLLARRDAESLRDAVVWL